MIYAIPYDDYTIKYVDQVMVQMEIVTYEN